MSDVGDWLVSSIMADNAPDFDFARPHLDPHWNWLVPIPAQPKPRRELSEDDKALHRAIAASRVPNSRA